jgi:hypothetical protein
MSEIKVYEFPREETLAERQIRLALALSEANAIQIKLEAEVKHLGEVLKLAGNWSKK